jgi:hypothetical protein
MFGRERQLGPREAADLDASRRIELTRDAGCRFTLALQSFLQQFSLGIRLGESLDKHCSKQEGDGGAGNRGVDQESSDPVGSEAS